MAATLLVGAGLVSACEPGPSMGKELIATPSSLSFNGIEVKEVSIKWGGFSKVIVANEVLGGKNPGSFEIVGGPHCEIEFKSGSSPCVEKIKLKVATKGLSATLVLENNFGNFEVLLTS